MGNCGSSESDVPKNSNSGGNKPKEIPVRSSPSLSNNSSSNGNGSSSNPKIPDSTAKNKTSSGQNGRGNERDEERKEESRKVNAAAAPVKQTSKPNLSLNTKHENSQKDSTSPPTPQQIAAVQRIQRLVRNKSAWKLAQAEREWKVNSHSSSCHLPSPPSRFLVIWTLKTRQIC